MTSAQIQTLLRPPDHDVSVKHAVSLLNSAFTTLGQVRTGSALANSIHAAKAVSDDYDSQLASSKSNIDLLERNVRCSAQDYLVSAKELSLLRHSLADELATLSDELVSSSLPGESEPSLLEEVEALHRDLQELQNVKGYVQVIHRALQLSEQAVREMKQAPASFAITEASVTDYVLLRELVNSVGQTCKKPQSGTGQEIKLLSFLIELLNKTWSGIKETLFSSLLSAAEDLHWPMPIDYATAKPESRKAFECAFVNLLKLQEIGERLHSSPESDGRAKLSKDGLYPLQALIRPVALRFKYHFEGTRQTNRLDKPEWYFAHILNVSHEHRPFLEAVVQRLVHISSIYKSTNVWREFTRLLFPILSSKLRRSMPVLLPHPPLLAHTVYQALAFDDALREAGFSLIGTLEKSKEDLSVWEGISDIILGSKDWFNAWLEGERRFAEDQYIDIISASDAWQFSEDAEEDVVNDQEVRPTNSARRVKALIEQITDRYRSLPRFLHKTRFLIAVQVPIVELYHTRISESLDAFESLSSFLARAVPGALAGQTGHGRDMKNSTTGVEGAQRLVKAYVSAKWMSAVMQSWGEDMFFLELWREICEKASLRSHVEDVDALPDPNVVKDEETIFEELVAQYNKLAERAESMLVRQICGEVEADLKAHLFNSMTEAEDAAISQTLLGPIAHLSAHISFLRKTLPVATVVRLYRKVAAHVGTHVLQRQLLYRGRGRMSSREGHAALDEANLWVEASRMALGGTVRRVEMPWERLLEAGRLLSLDEESFQQAVRAVRLGDERDYEKLAEVVGIIEMSSEEVMEVLSVREDYPNMTSTNDALNRDDNMPVELLDNGNKLRLVHPKGSTTEVLLYGATVISWKAPSPDSSTLVERLFVSAKAALDGSKPVRGGIPVVFPIFGAPTRPEHARLSQHGYARSSMWTWDGKTVLDNEAGVSVRLTFSPDASLTQDQVALAYVITLAEHQLSTDLHVTNTSSIPLEFQALLHTYIRAPVASLHIGGLKGLYYTDKTLAGTPRLIEQRATADVQQFTDFVYENGPREYMVTWPAGGIKVKAIGFEDVVLWNPGAAAGGKIADMEEGGWERYVCVEPGYVSKFKQIQPGETWIGGQVLTPIKPPDVFPA